MRIFKTPAWIKKTLPGIIWSKNPSIPTLYLSFDDGPIPEATPWVIDTLKDYAAKATFFCVGDNVRKYPHLKDRLLKEGHQLGNHTMHHWDAWKFSQEEYLQDIQQCSQWVESDLFRPPYGHLKPNQYWEIKKTYRIIYWDLISYDFDPDLSPEKCLRVLKSQTRSGSILVFHDSLKSIRLLKVVLPEFLKFCKDEGYAFETIA